MADQLRPEEVHAWFKEHFRERPDIGVWKATLDVILQPRNPFETEKSRLPKLGFLIAAGIATAGTVWFYFFNFVR